jgi:transposase
MKHFVGIDNSKLTHSVSIIDENGTLLKTFDVENDYSGFEKLHKIISGYDDPVIAFELPHEPLVDFLRRLPYKMFSLNPLK